MRSLTVFNNVTLDGYFTGVQGNFSWAHDPGIAQLAAAGLVDEYQLVVLPVVLGAGRTMFEGVPGPVGLTLTQSRAFPGGKVLLGYRPAG